MRALAESLGLVSAVISAAAGFASLIPFFFNLQQKSVEKASRSTRVGLAIGCVVVSVVSGVVSVIVLRKPPADRAPLQNPVTVTVVEQATVPITASSLATLATTNELQPGAQPITKPATRSHSAIAVSEQGRAIPELTAAADDALIMLRSHSHTVRGNLRGMQSAPDVSLQGLITTDLTLDVRLMDVAGVVRDSFTITSRGGGFTDDASGLQARERLRDALERHIQKEKP
jgi:hypothetical protein